MTDHYKSRREQEGTPEDRLTSLHDDLLISILSFLSIKQRVALSAVCARFRLLLPSIPRLDAFRLDVGLPSGGFDVHQKFTLPCALIRQCRIVFDDPYCRHLPKTVEQLLVDDLAKAGVQDLILEPATGKAWLDLSRRDCGLFGIKSLRSLSLARIQVSEYKYSDRRPFSPLGCALLTSFKMDFCIIRQDFLLNLLASCPFLETLQLILFSWLGHGPHGTDTRLSIHSASIKHLVLLKSFAGVNAIEIHCPNLESLIVEVVNELRIVAPKVRNASFLHGLYPPSDPPVALMKFLEAPFRKETAWLMLNSSKTPNILVTENDKFFYREYKDSVIVNLDFNLKDQQSTVILTQLLKKCNELNTKFDILTNSTHIESTNEDDLLLHDSTEVELIDLQMKMSEKTFERFLLNQKEMTEKLKEIGFQVLRSRTSKEQLEDILASEESLFQVSASIANCIEMKF